MGFRDRIQLPVTSWVRFGAFVVVLILAGTANVNAQECSSKTFNFTATTVVIENISATQVKVPIAKHLVEHVSSVTVSALQGYELYITAEITTAEPKELIISTNEAFEDFLQKETIPLLQSSMSFTCASGTTRSIRLRVTLKEENLSKPTFSKQEYIIQLPLPLPKNFDLTQYVDEGKGIIAYDNDLTGNEITFSLATNPHFLVEQVPGASRKEFIARIRTTGTLTRLEEDLSLTITGTDAGVPPMAGSSVLKISGDPLIPYIEPPQFVDPLYRVTYNRSETFSPVEVNLIAGTFDSSSRFVLSGENGDMFSITEKGDRSRASVTLKAGVTIPETMHFLSAVVTASRTGSELNGRTAIVVDVEQEVKVLPAFEQSVYAGTVDPGRVIALQTEVKLEASTVLGGVEVSLTGEDAEFFSFAIIDETIRISASDKLTVDLLQEKFYFHFTVQATKSDVGSALAFVVLEVLKQDVILPKFEKLFYEGNVTEEGVAEIPEVKITEDTYFDGLAFNKSGDIDFFSINIDGNKVTLVPKGITAEKLSGKLYLLVRISVSHEQEVQAETIVIIKILRQEIITPEFENNFLQSKLLEENLQFTPLKVVINITTWTTATKVVLKDSSNMFDLTPLTTTSNEYSINLRSGAQLPSESQLTLMVEANNPKSSVAACFVLIDVVRVPLIAPEFEQTLYESTLDSSGSLQELKLKLKPETYDASITFSLVDQDSALFQPQKLENNELLITFKESTTADDWDNRSNLRFNVRAVKPGTPEALVPVVIFIEKAEVRTPRFERPLYKSFIGPDLVLVPFETIQLVEETVAQGLELSILQNNTDLFTVQMVQVNKFTISLKKDLTPADLEGIDRLEFVIEATNPGVGSGFATFVVDVIRETVVVPEFTKVSYSGTLQEGSQVMSFTEKVTLKSESITNGVQYAVAGEDFTLVKHWINDDRSLSFSLQEEVTVEQLKSKSQIYFIVQANNPGSVTASASIVVRIVRPVQVAFEKSSFSGVLNEGQSAVDFGSNQIQFVEGTLLAGARLELSEGESNFFQVSLTAENVIQLFLNPSVNWNQIRFHSYLDFKLSATNPGSDHTATTTIIVNVVNRAVPTPVFTKTFYRGSLQKGSLEVTFPATEVIALQADTITSTLSFQVTENDADFFKVTREENKFKVSLKDDQTSVEGRDLLSFRIEANNEFSATDSAVVLVSIQLEEIITPVFQAAVYRGLIKEKTSDLSFSTELSFQQGTANGNTEVGLIDGDADWFVATHDNSKVIIAVKEPNPIKWDDISDRNFLSFGMQAVNPGSAPATASVTLDIQRSAVIKPKFKSPSFQGTLKEGSRAVEFSEGTAIELEDGSLVPGSQVSLSGSDFEWFDHVLEGLQVKITLKESVREEDLEGRKYLRFNVAATNPGSETATANVLVDLQRDSNPLNVPQFEKYFYGGSIGQDLKLSLDGRIMIKEETYSVDVQYGIVETNSDLLEVVKQDREVLVKLVRSITADDLQGLESLHMTIKAFSELGAESVCFLVISLPVENQETCPSPTPPSVDCTDCYDCNTGGPLDDVPVFAYGNYRFFLKSDNTGLIGTVKATVKDPSTTLEHRADITDGYLSSRVSFSSEGILRVEESLLPGQYTFQVTALNPKSQKQSSANVLLDVTQDQECPVDPEAPKITTVEKLLLIESLQEEAPHQNIFPSQLGSCEYELIDEKPYLGFNYFEIDSNTHWLTSRSFDRENTTLFNGMIIPQFQLRLHLVCPTESNPSRLTKRSLIDTGDLNYARDVTVINVIVLDINDNDPQFVEPPASNDPFHVGFPVSSIASGLMLPHLITVRATDADEGLNAKIRFSLSSNTHFGIDSETGMIYPLKDALKTNSVTSMVVTATDRDGASDGRSSTVQLSVHRLEEDNLVMVTVPGLVDTEGLLKQINANTMGVQVKVLTQARVSESTSDSRTLRQSSSENSILRMIVYAFNGQNVVQSSETITSVIRSSSLSTSVTTESYTNVACSGNPNCSGHQSSDDTNVGLIVATSVLGVLFLLSTGVAIFLYIRFVRPLISEPENPSDVVQLENDFEISPPPSPPMLAGGKQKTTGSPEMEERKTSMQILGITDQESEDSGIPTSRLARSLEDRLERVDEFGTISSRDTIEDSSSLPVNEPRNVKFNEMVERIEVVEHHPEDHRQHRVDLGDGDSVLSERL